MYQTVVLTITQALQFAILAPCVLMVIYLLASVRNISVAIVPLLYFAALAAGCLDAFLPLWGATKDTAWEHFALILVDSLIPALSFLLVMQFLHNSLPKPLYWLVLLVPLLASTPFIYSAVFNAEFCLSAGTCIASSYAFHLHNVVMSALVFMLLMMSISRMREGLAGDRTVQLHKYWLIVALVGFNLVLLVVDLRLVQGGIDESDYVFARSVVKLGFVYMVLSSIFRVFYEMFDIRYEKLSPHKAPLTAWEVQLADQAEQLLGKEKIYRSLNFDRSQFATKLGIKEHQLSRIINQRFSKSFSELANDYRIAEAKDLLEHTENPITVISFDVGFSSITSFNRVFKERTGLSPSDYRQQAQEKKIV